MVEVAAQTTTPKRRDDHLVWNRPVCRPVWTKPHPFTVITNGTFRQVIHPVLPLLTTRSRHPPICALGDRSPRTVKMSPPLGMPGYTPHQATVSRAKDGEAVIAQVPGRASGHGRHGGHGENTAAKGGGGRRRRTSMARPPSCRRRATSRSPPCSRRPRRRPSSARSWERRNTGHCAWNILVTT